MAQDGNDVVDHPRLRRWQAHAPPERLPEQPEATPISSSGTSASPLTVVSTTYRGEGHLFGGAGGDRIISGDGSGAAWRRPRHRRLRL